MTTLQDIKDGTGCYVVFGRNDVEVLVPVTPELMDDPDAFGQYVARMGLSMLRSAEGEA